MVYGDTIAAISSAVGPAARMIVRVSGPKAFQIVVKITGEEIASMSGGEARRVVLQIMNLPVPAWVYLFRAPHSYSGEDLIEFHIPGNPLLARMLLDELMYLGARAAEPGEFTARAFFNGRLDLTAAEGVAATISAHSEQELSAARQLLAGELSCRLRPMMDELAEIMALVEVGIDFSEEDVTFISPDQVRERVGKVQSELSDLVAQSARFERVTHEPTFVLVGRPNAGKSTLLNALAGKARAVVSPIAGTTRDALSAHVELDRGVVRVIDVAGLEDADASNDIARQMQQRARQILHEVDFVILVQEMSDPQPMELPRSPDLVVRSKLDLAPQAKPDQLAISAVTGLNIDLLRTKMSELAFGSPTPAAASLALNARHIQAIDEAISALRRIDAALDETGAEVVALELREALNSLGQILGQLTPDDLLGRIFGQFCIGK
jgi:tRNA modification GTPase